MSFNSTNENSPSNLNGRNSTGISNLNLLKKNLNFIDLAKKSINNSDLVESEFYIILSLLNSNISIDEKINILSLKSFIYFKSLNEMLSNLVLKKIILLFNKKNLINTENNIAFIRIFYRSGMILYDNRKFFLAMQCFYEAKSLLGDEKDLDEIRKMYKESIKEIQKIVDIAKNKIFKKEEYIRNLKKVAASIDIKETIDEKPYYLISTVWLTYFHSFLKEEMKEKLFDLNKVCLINFWDEKTDGYNSRLQGNFPGPINNYNILDFKNFWFDPDIQFQHTNYFLKNNAKEDTDFHVVSLDVFDKLQSFFGCNYSIQRNTCIVNNHVIVDVSLKRFKIMVLNYNLSKYYKNHLSIKEIQFEKNDTIKDLKHKLIRCINHIVNESHYLNLNKCEFKIYIPQFDDKKTEIHKLLLKCVKNEFFNFIGEELKNDMEYIYNLKITPKDLILVEIKESKEMQWLLHLEKELRKYNCFYCKNEVEEIIRCNFCVEYYYCSNVCRSKDENHIFYHKNINSSIKTFKLEELRSIDISKLLDNTSGGGLVGLKNLGNTCFMNSAIQCLSHVIELTMYFLLNKYLNEINRTNKFGTNGKMVEAYYELIKELWLGNKSIISPWDFRQIFVSFSKQFAGYSQQDSHEMLVYVLDNLHEDLSRIKQKPYFEIKEKQENESEEDASERWWQNHLKRENSIIVDLFHGQFKSEIKCLSCGKVSITYDPFVFLGLPIPNTNFSIKLKFFWENPFMNMTLLDFIFTENSTVFDLKENILNKYKKNLFLIVMLTKDLQYRQILKDTEILLPFLERNDFEIIIWQTEYNIEDSYNKLFICAPMKIFEETSYLIIKNQIKKQFMYPKPFIISRELSVIDLHFEIFKYYRNIMPDIETQRDTSRFRMFYENKDDYNLEEEFNLYRKSRFFFKLLILNNISDSSMMFFKKNCEFCGEKCESCFFNFVDDLLIDDLYKKIINRKFFILLINFPILEKTPLENQNKFILVKNSNISIYDCLHSFKEGEKLNKENAWYCTNCMKHEESFKKMDLYRLPTILIIQFKRFKMKNSNLGFIQNHKNNTFIDYPLDELKISCQNSICSYDLFAVSSHEGKISSGHYTAICKNKDNWSIFDDMSVYKILTKQVVTESAYLLFYRKK